MGVLRCRLPHPHPDPPLEGEGGFADFGSHYQRAIFYLDEAQRAAAEEPRREMESSKPFDRPVVTDIRPNGRFYPAEEYHHQYYRKEPLNYKQYYESCGRRGRLKELWSL